MFSVCFFSLNAKSQIDIPFIQHLSRLNLKHEHNEYLKIWTSNSDSSALFNAKFYIQYNEIDLFLKTVPTCVQLIKEDTNFLNYVHLLFLKDLTPNRERWFAFLNENQFDQSPIVEIYKSTESPSIEDTLFIPNELKKDFQTYVKAYKKKPWISASLSTLIPGLGELYIGNFQTFVTKFLSLSLFGIQSVESILILGAVQPLPVLNIGIFALFYGANIVGSFRDTNTKKQDFKNQFLLHAADYYNGITKSSIY